MQRTEIKQIFDNSEMFLGKQVTICGWVRTVRDSKSIGFLELNDGSCFKSIQVVFENQTLENYNEIAKLNVGSSVIISGIVTSTPQARQPFEIRAITIQVEGASTPEYPLQKKKHSLEYLRT